VRWKESGHFPLSNLYESLMFLSWCFTSLHLYIDYYTSEQNEKNVLARKLLGAITTPSALLTNAFATFTLPKEMQEAAPLVPALQSNWLMMHVTVMILSYAALILGSLLSIAFLVLTTTKKKNESNQFKYENFSLTLDNLSYRILGIGFPLLTIGILSGAVWANEAWGSYWSWDPKETWALLTWLIFAIYLHTRLSKGWEGKKPAIIASFGFLIVWICYLGVNLLGEGLHSYGWIVKS
jgi:cytochrome c-type biogenesis protein CcsB